MAEYRNANYPEADRMLRAAALSDHYWRQTTCKFYRAMSLFRQGKEAEARRLFAEAEAKREPLPADMEGLLSAANVNDLNLWLTYKEARDLLNAPRVAKP